MRKKELSLFRGVILYSSMLKWYLQYGPNQITNGNKTVGELKNAQKYNYLDMHHTSICNSLNSFHILHSLHSSKV